jgi:hypothetical protein
MANVDNMLQLTRLDILPPPHIIYAFCPGFYKTNSIPNLSFLATETSLTIIVFDIPEVLFEEYTGFVFTD